MKQPTPRALLLAGCAAALASVLSGCGAGDAAPDPTGDTAKTANVDSSATHVGDCRVEATTGLPEDAEVVPCTEPHDEQIFHTITLTGESFSADAIEAATQECVGDVFTTFIGVSKAESSLGVYVIAPTTETWEQAGARTVSCVVTDPAGRITGTLADSAR